MDEANKFLLLLSLLLLLLLLFISIIIITIIIIQRGIQNIAFRQNVMRE